jgi:hypothetical protein
MVLFSGASWARIVPGNLGHKIGLIMNIESPPGADENLVESYILTAEAT